MKKLIKQSLCLTLVVCIILGSVPANAETSYDGKRIASEAVNYGSTIDKDGNTVSSITSETKSTWIVDIYVNGEINHSVSLDKASKIAIITIFDQAGVASQETYDLNEHMQKVDSALATKKESSSTKSAITPNYNYNIYYGFNTDFTYQGYILRGDTYTKAYEPSESYRYNQTLLNFTRGDLVGTVVAALLAMSSPSGLFTVAALTALGIPFAANKLTDGIYKTVCFTTFRVYTNVYFNNIHTVYAYRTYNKVLVMAGSGGSDIFVDDYYGYNIIRSAAFDACMYGAYRFNEKYIACTIPDLSLPVTYYP